MYVTVCEWYEMTFLKKILLKKFFSVKIGCTSNILAADQTKFESPLFCHDSIWEADKE